MTFCAISSVDNNVSHDKNMFWISEILEKKEGIEEVLSIEKLENIS